MSIDAQGLPRNGLGRFRAQKGDECGNLFGLDEHSHGILLLIETSDFLFGEISREGILLDDTLDSFAFDRARTDGIDPYSIATQFHGPCFCESDQSPLRSGIGAS